MATLLLHFCVLLGVALTGVAFATDASRPPPPPWQVIVNNANAISSIDREFLADAFLKKATRWSDDKVIHPVDATSTSSVRRRFSEDVIRRSIAAVKSYWQQIVFSGRGVPPPEFDSDAAIIAYVQRNTGAVGYVSGATDTTGVRVVQVR